MEENKKESEKNWKMIAGKGELGDMMWGDWTNFDEEELKERYLALDSHKHEKVLLSGGGGTGVHVARLWEVWIELKRNGDGEWYKKLRVDLRNVRPKLTSNHKFTPYIGSWQISIWQGKGDFPKLLKEKEKQKELA